MSFKPQIVCRGRTRLEGSNERIIALYARGITTRDIRAHLREICDVEVSPDLRYRSGLRPQIVCAAQHHLAPADDAAS